MALAQSATDVANLALAVLGEGVIQNIEGGGTAEITMRRAYSETVRQVQLMIHWPELIKVSTPSKAADMFDSKRFRYNLPTSMLEIVRVLDSNNYDVEDWEIIEKKLVTESSDITIHYKRFSENVSEWSARMIEVIYRKLAVETCMKFTQDTGLLQVMQLGYEEARRDALSKTRSRNRNYKKNRTGFGYSQIRQRGYINKPIGYR